MTFGVYVHWPYCARICPYCDFNVRRDRGIDPAPLLGAIAADLAAHRTRLGPKTAASVFLGGGTPSRLGGAEVAAVLAAVDRAFPLAADAEITLEANPEDAQRFADHAAAGVNRFSLGLQALDDAALRALGRAHTMPEAIAAVAAAARTGRRVSVDLIYARPGQTASAWAAELTAALALPVEHLSLYQLTLEPGTPFARAAARGRLAPSGADLAADLYIETQATTEAAGFPAYEISNHARGPAAQSRHNLIYWRGGEWAGVGPGAHGRVGLEGARTATVAHRAPEAYIAAVAETGIGWASVEPVPSEAQAEEALLMGLRLAEGVDRAEIERLRGGPLAAVAALVAQGFLQPGPRLTLTPAGRLVADRIAADLAAS